MPDWNTLVREQLGGLGLNPAEQEQIVSELANHLQDVYEEGCAHGLCESGAMKRSLEDVDDWRRLARRINRAKRGEEVMNTSTTRFWFPGFVSLASAMVVWAILELMALQTHGGMLTAITNHLSSDPVDQVALAIYPPWVVLLPCCGAAGAYLSRRAGGSRPARVASGMLPSIVLVALAAMILPLEFLYCHTPFVIHHPFYFLGRALGSTAVPSAALLLGAAPFLRASRPQAS
jgi:hypothetical protein